MIPLDRPSMLKGLQPFGCIQVSVGSRCGDLANCRVEADAIDCLDSSDECECKLLMKKYFDFKPT